MTIFYAVTGGGGNTRRKKKGESEIAECGGHDYGSGESRLDGNLSHSVESHTMQHYGAL